MSKYQIEFKDGTSRSYSYFEAVKEIENEACQKANDVLERDKQNASFRSFGYFKPARVLSVLQQTTTP